MSASGPRAEERSERKGLSRRQLLISGGIVLGGAVYLGRVPFRRWVAGYMAQMDLPSGIKQLTPDFWFEVRADNTIVLKSPKAEMGQDIFTGFALLAAEELDVEPTAIVVEPGSTADSPRDTAGTGGSSTTASLYVPLRQVAATLRETLKLAAGRRWGVEPAEVATEDGWLIAGERRATYGEIASSTQSWTIAETPDLRPRSAFRYVGREHPRFDLEAKVMAEPIYGIDAELPEMAYATVLYSPYIGGQLASVDGNAAERFPGVLQVVREDDLVAVVAESRYAAEMGKRALEAEWEVPRRWQQADIDELVTVGTGRSVSMQADGNVRRIFAGQPATLVEAEYRTPLAAHAHLEPNGVVARVDADRALIISGTQIPSLVQSQVAKALGLDRERVEVRNRFLGGGFGRRYHRNNAVEAARVARAVGRPVHVFKDREDEFRSGYLRPNTHHVLRGALAGDGTLEALEHLGASGDMILENSQFKALKPVLGGDIISAGHGLRILYDVPNRSAELFHKVLPFQTGIWRGVGMFTNAFATESFIDELAAAAGSDPLDFRLRHLVSADPIVQRQRAVLEAAAAAAGWGARAPGTGWGIACAEDRKTVVAAVVRVDVVDGSIRVLRVTQAIDPGLVVHPEGVRAQVQGATMMGLSSALYEEVRIEDGRIAPTNYHQYPIATLDDAPEIDVVLLEGAEKPSGVGEPPIAPVAPAIANAVFDLTGQRLRSLPLRLA